MPVTTVQYFTNTLERLARTFVPHNVELHRESKKQDTKLNVAVTRALLQLSDLGVVVEGGEDVVRKTREKVDDEPALEVVHADDTWLRHHLTGRADELSATSMTPAP